MTFHWPDYFDLAKALANPNLLLPVSDEARQRAAISRAYYASFCAARNYLRMQQNNNALFTNGSAHLKVREALVSKGSKPADQLAKLLLETHRERKRADYEDDYDPGKALPGVLRRVQQIFSLLDQNP